VLFSSSSFSKIKTYQVGVAAQQNRHSLAFMSIANEILELINLRISLMILRKSKPEGSFIPVYSNNFFYLQNFNIL
jgi:hypothetical protein